MGDLSQLRNRGLFVDKFLLIQVPKSRAIETHPEVGAKHSLNTGGVGRTINHIYLEIYNTYYVTIFWKKTNKRERILCHSPINHAVGGTGSSNDKDRML